MQLSLSQPKILMVFVTRTKSHEQRIIQVSSDSEPLILIDRFFTGAREGEGEEKRCDPYIDQRPRCVEAVGNIGVAAAEVSITRSPAAAWIKLSRLRESPYPRSPSSSIKSLLPVESEKWT